MTRIKSNLVSFDELIKDFDLCVQNYNQSIDSFFKYVNQFKGWEGEAGQKYLDTIISEGSSYVDFGTSLQSFNDVLSDTLKNLNATIKSSARN